MALRLPKPDRRAGKWELVLAEVELEDESVDPALPPWVGEEVSDDVRYYNTSLAALPFVAW